MGNWRLCATAREKSEPETLSTETFYIMVQKKLKKMTENANGKLSQ